MGEKTGRAALPYRAAEPLAAVRLLLAGALLAAMLVPMGAAPAMAQPASRFWISNLEGERFDGRTHPGPIVLSFFFVGCVPCVREIPQLHALITTVYPEAALLFIDPIGDDTADTIGRYATRLGVPARFFYRDPLGRLARRFIGAQGTFPTIVALKDGAVAAKVHDLGESSQVRLRAALE